MFKVYTALITPFHEDKSIDYESLDSIIEDQLDQGCDGFIVCGTTAESPVLSEEEKFHILNFVIMKTKHRIPIWFGCGSNATAKTIKLAQRAEQYDIDGLLIVTPYYNKPSQGGLFEHFKAIHDVTKLPIMLYNVPSRTGVSLQYETIRNLILKCPRITALKQASDDFETVRKLCDEFPDFQCFSGEDGSFKEGWNHGMCGLISVMSHYNLKAIKDYVVQPTDLDKEALYEFAHYCFLQSSPSTIKYMLSKKGLCKSVVRLPLVELTLENKKEIDSYLD